MDKCGNEKKNNLTSHANAKKTNTTTRTLIKSLKDHKKNIKSVK